MDLRIMTILFLTLICSFKLTSGKQIIVVKTVQNKYGDVFDCIDINSQPSLNHPLLKNHTIQMRPTLFPLDTNEGLERKEYKESNISVIDCPLGTTPFSRTDYEAKTARFRRFSLSNRTIQLDINEPKEEGEQYFVGYIERFGEHKGTKASVTVYEPKINDGQGLSGAMSTIVDISNVHTIGAGWWVEPKENGDNYAHFDVFWAEISRKKECVNLRCPGFIQVSTKIAAGARLSPVSTYNGKQYSMTVKLFQDGKTGNWWVAFGQNDEPIGYWPKAVIPKLTTAFYSAWGGETDALKKHLVPPMGSEHFASEGYGKAAFFSDILVVNKENKFEIPNTSFLWKKNNKNKCYELGGVMKGKTGFGFFFGGPGGC